MASSVKGGATGSDDATVGTIAWTNATRIVTNSDGLYADCALTASAVGHYLKAVNFGFAIDAGATITGVLVDMWGYNSGTVGDIKDTSVKLVKGGTITGNDLALNATAFSNNASPVQATAHGADGQMWGVALTPTDVNSATFGCVVSFTNTNAGTPRTCRLDYVQMTVYYTLPAAESSPSTAHLATVRDYYYS